MNKLPKDVERIWGSGTPVKVKPRPKKRKANKTKLKMENEALKLKIENLKLDKQKLRKQCDSFAFGIAFIMLSIIIATIIELIKRGQI